MAHVLTTAGAAHIVELDAASPLTDAFDALILSRGNDVPTSGDDRSAVASGDEITGSLTVVATAHPHLADTDPRNTGAGATKWTWRFDIPPGLAGLVASNLVVTNYASGAPSATEALLMHGAFATPLEKLTAQRATIFINVAAGAAAGSAPVVVVAIDEPNVLPRLHTYTSRARMLAVYGPNGIGRAMAVASAGENVRVMAVLHSYVAGLLTPTQVQSASLEVLAHQIDGRWLTLSSENVGAASVTADLQYGDARWPYPGGYNWAHDFEVPEFSDETGYRLLYTIREKGGPAQVFQVEIRSGPEATGVGA